MSKKLYFLKIICIILISSLLSTWFLMIFLDYEKEGFAFYYTLTYLAILSLSCILCIPMILLTDLIGKVQGPWVMWILKLVNYHLPIFFAITFYFYAEKYPLFFEIPVLILLLTEWIIKKQKAWKPMVFITCAIYLIHILIFLSSIALMLMLHPVSE